MDCVNQRQAAHPKAAAQERPVTQLLWQRLQGCLFALIGWVLSTGNVLFSVNPLGLALLCADERYTLWVFCGTLLGTYQRGTHVLWNTLALLSALVLRLLARLYLTPPRPQDKLTTRQLRTQYRSYTLLQLRRICRHGGEAAAQTGPKEQLSNVLPPLFDEPLYLRILIALVSALIPCLAIPISGGFAYYDLYGSLFYLACAPIATRLLAWLNQETEASNTASHVAPTALIGQATLLFAVCLCSRSLTLLGIYPAVALVVFLCLRAVDAYGFIGGIAVGVLGGLAIEPSIIPLFLCLSVLYAVLHPVVGGFSLLPAILAALAFLLLSGGSRLFWQLCPSTAVGVLCFSAFRAVRRRLHKQDAASKPKSYRQDPLVRALLTEQARNDALQARICAMAGSFGGLSEVFRQLGDCLRHPGVHELRHMCDEAYDRYCPDCPKRQVCWASEYPDTLECINRISNALLDGESASEQQLSSAMRTRCPNVHPIMGEINYRYTRRSYELLHGTQSELFAQSYDAIAHLMRDALPRDTGAEDDPLENVKLAERVAKVLDEQGMSYRHVSISGNLKKQIRILGLSPAGLTVDTEQLQDLLGTVCGVRFSAPQFDGTGEGMLTLCAVPRLRAEYVHRSLAAPDHQTVRQGGRTVCGDAIRTFEGLGDMFYALLCDGMGSGRGAAMTSGVCAVFLERVLRAGVSVGTALRMLNYYLRARVVTPEDEYSSTVDLFSLNLYSGKAQFIKSGAAMTILLRGGQLFRIDCHTVPIGILHAIDAQILPFDIQPGDRIFMMSDGITEISPECEGTDDDWLTTLLSGELPEDDDALITLLMQHAKDNGSRDDLSVIAIRIHENIPQTKKQKGG